MTGRNRVRQFRATASTFDWPALHELACDYADHLYSVSSLPDDVGPILMVLREALRYEDLEIVADAALAHELVSPTVRRLYAQALVDGGNPAVALQLYTDLATDETALVVDQMEARGGIGRCYKEMFLSCTEPARRQRYLTRSLDAYLTAYQENSAPHVAWHQRRGPAGAGSAGRHCASSGNAVGHRVGRRDLAVRRLVTGTRHVDRGDGVRGGDRTRPVRRGRRARGGVHRDDATRVHGGGVPPPAPEGLAAHHIELSGQRAAPGPSRGAAPVNGGQVTVESTDVRATRLAEFDDAQLERVFGPDSFLPLTWYRTGLQRCRAVARIQNGTTTASAPGFSSRAPTCMINFHPWFW